MRKIVMKVELERVIRTVCVMTGVRREDLFKSRRRGSERALLMEILYRHGGMNQREIGKLLGLDYSSVSVARKKYQALAAENQRVLKLEQKIESHLIQ